MLACKLHTGNLRGENRIAKLIRMSKEAVVVEYELRKRGNKERMSNNLII